MTCPWPDCGYESPYQDEYDEHVVNCSHRPSPSPDWEEAALRWDNLVPAANTCAYYAQRGQA